MADNIFGNLSTPQWMSPAEADNQVGPFAESIARDYTQAYFHARNNASQNDRTQALISAKQQQQKDENDFQQKQIDRQSAKVAEIAPKLAGVKSPQAAWDVVSQNPQWLVDPDTAPIVGNFLKTQNAVATAYKNSVSGRIAIQDGTDFLKQLNAVDPMTRSQISGMKANEDGTPSPMMWQTLNTALETANVSKQNEQKQAEIDALAGGGQETTTIGPKGITKTIKPTPPPTAASRMSELLAKPDQMTLPDGSVITRGAGSHQWFKTPKDGGEQKPFTQTELRNAAKDLPDTDPRKAQIQSSLADAATNQLARVGVFGRSPKAVNNGNNLPVIQTQQDYDKLSIGSAYLDSKGVRAIKKK